MPTRTWHKPVMRKTCAEMRFIMIIEKEYFDAREVERANAMNDKSLAPLRRIRLATTDSNR